MSKSLSTNILDTRKYKKKQKLICETFENWKGKTNQNIAFSIYTLPFNTIDWQRTTGVRWH